VAYPLQCKRVCECLMHMLGAPVTRTFRDMCVHAH
jgi:hypothetical protein